jgi:TolB protein
MVISASGRKPLLLNFRGKLARSSGPGGVAATLTARLAQSNIMIGRSMKIYLRGVLITGLQLVAALGCASAKESEATRDDRETSLSHVVQLTHGFARAGEAYFSPDMNWIIFQATPVGETHYAMYVAKLKKKGEQIVGSETPRRVSPVNTRNTCGFFSPDGESLIFASTTGKEKGDAPAAGYQRESGGYRWDFPDGMEIFRVDGWAERLLTPEAYATDLATNPITNNTAYDAEGSYSPDGRWILFTSRRDGDSELYVMKPDGSGAVRLTDVPGYDGGPFFAPDGKRIIFRSDRKAKNLLQVFVADLAFDSAGNISGITNQRQVTDDENVNWAPYFHPDNTHIVFTTSAYGHENYELDVIRDDGSHRMRLTFKEGFDGLPVFSRDGKYLMWSSKRSKDGTAQVFLAPFKAPADW